jgi:hypothetical protein
VFCLAEAHQYSPAMWMPRGYVDIEQAIGSAEETTQLDFKEELGSSQDIAKDIASMTIDGGVLVYGVKEKDAVAVGITPVSLAGAPERIQQIANSSVDPLPAIEVEPLRANPGDDVGIVVVVVEASPLAPHMANDRYPARSGTTTRYLSQSEVERLYAQRRGFSEVEETRRRFAGFVPPPTGAPIAVADAMGRLSLFINPVVPRLHPLGVRVRQPLLDAVHLAREAMEAVGVSDSNLLDQLEDWQTRETSGWSAGNAPSESLDLPQARNLGVFGFATYMHSGTLSFEVETVVTTETGARYAYESLWAKETIASLATAGNFYRNVPGVTFVDVDLRLNNLEGAVTEKAWTAAYIKNPRKVEVPGYDESGRFSVAELASDPRNAARRLLDRFFVSFLGDGADVIDELSKPAN